MSNGEVLLRLGPDIDRLRKAAEAEGISMSQLLREGMEMRIAAGRPGTESLRAALLLVEKTARELADDLPAASPNGSGPQSWDAVMEDTSSLCARGV
jgi:hypothetical protein